ncbi:MAG: TPM domain-containing protein [Burkholderiales bacterium]|nr:TPM domain-containing protein [Burkholderiales bacterium]
MSISRRLRHLFTSARSVRQAFPDASLARIEQAIAGTEALHGGQVCFAIEAALDGPALWAGQPASERAVELFGQLRVWDTERNNGVLIYLLWADRDVEIVADRGIHSRVGAEGWEAVCRQMEAAFREGRFEAGALAGIEAVGALLSAHYPGDGLPRNEVPDRPVLL